MPHTSLAAIVWGSKKTHGWHGEHGLVFSRMFFDSVIWLHVDSYGFWRKRHRFIKVLTKKRACSKSVESSYNQLMNQWDKLKKIREKTYPCSPCHPCVFWLLHTYRRRRCVLHVLSSLWISKTAIMNCSGGVVAWLRHFLRHVCKCLIIKGRSRCFGWRAKRRVK